MSVTFFVSIFIILNVQRAKPFRTANGRAAHPRSAGLKVDRPEGVTLWEGPCIAGYAGGSAEEEWAANGRGAHNSELMLERELRQLNRSVDQPILTLTSRNLSERHVFEVWRQPANVLFISFDTAWLQICALNIEPTFRKPSHNDRHGIFLLLKATRSARRLGPPRERCSPGRRAILRNARSARVRSFMGVPSAIRSAVRNCLPARFVKP